MPAASARFGRLIFSGRASSSIRCTWQYFLPRTRGALHTSPFPFGYWHLGALFARSIVLFILLKIFWFTSSNSSAFSCNRGSSITHCRYASKHSPNCFSSCPARVVPHACLSRSRCSRNLRSSRSRCSRNLRSSRCCITASRLSSEPALLNSLLSFSVNPLQSSPSRYPKSSLTPYGTGLPFISAPACFYLCVPSCPLWLPRGFPDFPMTRCPDFHPHP